MKILFRLVLLAWVILCGVILTSGQKPQTARGYFCGMSEGDGGFPSIRVGNVVTTFSIYSDEPKAKYIGFRNRNLFQLQVGSELIVTFVNKKKYRQVEKLVRSLTLTGNVNRRTKPCSEDS